jgi:aldose sugar dehydrogenase
MHPEKKMWTSGRPLFALVALAAACTAPADVTPREASQEPPADTTPVPFRVATVVEGLEHPWGMAFLPGDEGILVTERPGRLRLVRNGRLEPQPLAGIPEVRAQGQGGLLDVEVHPDFASNRLVYLSYSKPGPRGATTAVARGRLGEGGLTDVQDVFVADAWGTGGSHFGSRIVFDHDGYMYVTVGDRGEAPRAQDPRDHAGTTIRLHDDGRVPRDNPFVGRADARDEIYTFGNRNAQGMVVHPETGEVWQHEHGPRGGDELHRIQPGRNYGWPEVSFGTQYDGRPIPDPRPDAGAELPLLHWTPSIAPSGMTVYTGDVFPQWRGDLFVGALALQHLNRVSLRDAQPREEERLLDDRGHRIRDVKTGPDGLIYLLVDAASAPLLRLEPQSGG